MVQIPPAGQKMDITTKLQLPRKMENMILRKERIKVMQGICGSLEIFLGLAREVKSTQIQIHIN